jgi:hypothetical protein
MQVRDGRMDKFMFEPTRGEKLEVLAHLFEGLHAREVRSS